MTTSYQHDDPLAIARDEARAMLDGLTEKQTDLLVLGARGHTITQIVGIDRHGRSRRTIEDHFVASRKKLNAQTNQEAVERFIILRTICGEPTRGFYRVDLTNEDIEKLFRALSFERAASLLSSSEFQEFMQAYRSSGPEALNARYGMWWKPIVGLLLAIAIVAFVVLGFAAAPLLNDAFN